MVGLSSKIFSDFFRHNLPGGLYTHNWRCLQTTVVNTLMWVVKGNRDDVRYGLDVWRRVIMLKSERHMKNMSKTLKREAPAMIFLIRPSDHPYHCFPIKLNSPILPDESCFSWIFLLHHIFTDFLVHLKKRGKQRANGIWFFILCSGPKHFASRELIGPVSGSGNMADVKVLFLSPTFHFHWILQFLVGATLRNEVKVVEEKLEIWKS